MQSFALVTLTAIASAGKVHSFFAESNLMCSLCETVIEKTMAGHTEEVNALFTQFPKLQMKIEHGLEAISNINFRDATGTCKQINMCEEQSMPELILAEMPLDFNQHIEYVNNMPHSTWRATNNAKFEGASYKEFRNSLGTIVDPDWRITLNEKMFTAINADLPTNFDASTNWPECASVILNVRDQAACGSCWAHATTTALNDRRCIASGGAETTFLSVADTTACCDNSKCYSFGCNGGQIGLPWQWFMSEGVVSGGNLGDNKLCFDYTMPQCAHHVAPVAPMVDCDDAPEVAPVCKSTC